jgi:acyl-CoA thioester hydrolase
MTRDAAEASRHGNGYAHDDGRSIDKSYERTFHVRLDEIDFNGHLYSTKYLEYASHTRYCHLAETGWDLRTMKANDIGAVALSDEISYQQEVLLGEPITVVYQITGYSADRRSWRSRIRVVRSDGAVAASITMNGTWFGQRSRRIQASPSELASATDSIRPPISRCSATRTAHDTKDTGRHQTSSTGNAPRSPVAFEPAMRSGAKNLGCATVPKSPLAAAPHDMGAGPC